MLMGICMAALCAGCVTDSQDTKKRVQAREDMGLSFLREGNANLAVKHLLEAERLDPENANVQHDLALAYEELRLYDKALAHFKRALKIRPEFPQVENNMGVLYLALGQWDNAIASFERAVDTITYPTPHYAYMNMGLAYYNKGDYQSAADKYLRALSIDRSYTRCYVNLGTAYEALGKWEDALKAYETAVTDSPRHAGARLALGTLLLKLGREGLAARELKKTCDIDPKGPYGRSARELLVRHDLFSVN